MRIKYSNRTHSSNECPEQKLKNISFTHEILMHRSLVPPTPDRNKKQSWIMDPWEITEEKYDSPHKYDSPEKEIVLTKHVQNNSACKQRLKKRDRYEDNYVLYTPQTAKRQSAEKENKYRGRLYSQVRSKNKIEQIEDIAIFKKPISSIVYPLGRDYAKDKGRRIDRFHSFIARSIRK